MTLFKQIAIMLSIFLILILSTVLILNFQSANESVQERLYEDAKNTATSLSLSLGTANGDVSVMSTMINANFDSGNYLQISLIDVDDEILYERVVESASTDVPAWFLSSVKIEAPVASANVSAGWSQVGILNVQSDVAYAYSQLYTILINLLLSFGIFSFVALVVLNLLLIAILKPLKEVQRQAEAVIRNEFILQGDIPYTKEFRDVVLGMNNMVSKVKATFDKGNEELKRQKELEYIDQNTKLKNRKYLIAKLPEYLKIDATSKGGVNMMLSFSGVVEANTGIGYKEVDKLFISMADIFQAHANNYEESIVARMNGTEFSIFLPNCSSENALELAKGIKNTTDKLIQTLNLDNTKTFLSIGLYEYNYKQSIGQLLSLSDNALTQAKFTTSHLHLEKAENSSEVMGKDAWRTIINRALELNNFQFVSYQTVNTKAKHVEHNALSLTLQTQESTYYYGQFMAPASQADLSNAIYSNVLNKMFKTPDKRLQGSPCSLRLSYEYLKLESSYDELVQLLKKYGEKFPLNLIVEIPDKLVRKNPKEVKRYKALFVKYSIEIGLYEFIGESSDYYYLQELRPIYIKAESSYFLTQSDQALSALRLITDTIGISLIASGVMDMETLHKLQEKDIYIIQGKATEMVELHSPRV